MWLPVKFISVVVVHRVIYQIIKWKVAMLCKILHSVDFFSILWSVHPCSMKCLSINNLQISSSCTNSLIKNISYNISYNVYQMSMSIYRLTHKSSLYLPIQMTVFHLSHEVIQFHQVQLKLLCTHLMARISQLEYFHQSLSSMRKSTMNYMHLIQINLACLISAS